MREAYIKVGRKGECKNNVAVEGVLAAEKCWKDEIDGEGAEEGRERGADEAMATRRCNGNVTWSLLHFECAI